LKDVNRPSVIVFYSGLRANKRINLITNNVSAKCKISYFDVSNDKNLPTVTNMTSFTCIENRKASISLSSKHVVSDINPLMYGGFLEYVYHPNYYGFVFK